MAKINKRLKDSQAGQKFNDEALENLTRKIDSRLSEKTETKKRKAPPTSKVQLNPKKPRSDQKPKSSKSSKSLKGSKIESLDLLAEVKALGGDERDLELINDVNSSDEGSQRDTTKPADKKLISDLLALSQELGLADHAPSEASEADDGSERSDDEGLNRNVQSPQRPNSNRQDVEPQIDLAIPTKGPMMFEPCADWHAASLPHLPKPTADNAGTSSPALEALKSHAKTLLDQDAMRYKGSMFAKSSHKFLATIMSTGTLSDKVSALTLAIQESPVHNTRAFEALLTLASKKSRAQAISSLGALVDSLGPGAILPPNRRLYTFQTQPGLLGTLEQTFTKSWSSDQRLPGKLTAAHLVAWAYEDWLKDAYFQIIQILEGWCADEIEYSRMRAIDFVYGLLKEKPEQESNLLRLLVNKLGDRDRKISSRASYLLLQLQNSHPGMKPIVIKTIEQDILQHPSHDHRSKYYAITTLNQTILSAKDPTVAESLVRIYFDLFLTLLKTGTLGVGFGADPTPKDAPSKDKRRPRGRGKPTDQPSKPAPSGQDTEAADKLVSGILMGVNRAAPFVGGEDSVMEKHLDTLFKIAHSANFNTGIQALMLIQHLSSSRNLTSDRFYRTLYESLLDPRLMASSKQALYLNLLLRALKNDVDVKRIKAFAKRMMQVASLHQPSFVCGLIYVIGNLRETFPDISTLIEDSEESIFDDDDEAAPKQLYDGRKRNPEHSNANRSCLWEVLPVFAHFHPSVRVIASVLLDRSKKVQKPDMESHSLIKFLDKFVYRNPKGGDGGRGASIMQPVRTSKDLGNVWLGGRGASKETKPINSSSFRNTSVEKVAAEDIFFHQYFQQTSREAKPTKVEDAEDAEDEIGEDEVWEALVSTRPEIEGNVDDASDVGFDDLDEDEMASEGDESIDLGGDGDMSDDMDDMDDAELEDVESDDDLVQPEVSDAGEGSDDERSAAKSRNKQSRDRKKELKALPMFASVDDYAELLAGDESS